MAAPARAFVFSRFADLSLKPSQPPPPISRHLLVRPLLPSSFPRRRLSAGSTSSVRCLISGVDGGGVSDEFVSTRKSGFDRGFSVISNMLKKIEPLDTSVISKGVSDSARDSMKQTISTMLGLLPSDQFSVTVRVCKAPLHRLLASSIITGYTLWNAEYRISLMRNFDISTENSVPLDRSEMDGVSDRVESGERDGGNGIGLSSELLDSATPQVFGDLPPEALNYIQTLQSELTNVKEELKAEKQENMQLEYDTGPRNDLLDYLRSLDSNMVTELSRPSSLEVKEIIHQLVQNILQRFFKDGTSSEFVEDLVTGDKEIGLDADGELETIGTSRDYLAKLLFWCMLLGHHLRGLENRLHLSCVVGLL
ncbi:hypothetical protein D8674_036275 [Pyrus ussuriensis x Pyrus communis]|uniref:Seed maturation-like protein n=1 Tax=Pyrus ussuriensis x Pyrus communis TaxID=2448454 RepID=A0A5N5GEN3_9ROSA|nr:uncharacterized protein LOC103928461 [Pyrus x bretschneideri]KAB2613959.1 hypothetical protein D8674_036275 [Pyrus ussuriensis x Pyrus communis]